MATEVKVMAEHYCNCTKLSHLIMIVNDLLLLRLLICNQLNPLYIGYGLHVPMTKRRLIILLLSQQISLTNRSIKSSAYIWA